MRVAVGADHAGLELKKVLVKHLQNRGVEVEDMGAHSAVATDDYPDYGRAVAQAVASGSCDSGILVCGTGLGMSMVANKFRGIRAALCVNELMAQCARNHNDANVLALGGRIIGADLAVSIVDTWLDSEFSGDPRHMRRIKKLEEPQI